MLATTTVSFHTLLPPTRSSLSPRLALVDSTNFNTRSDVCGPGPKSSTYPTSSVRTSCGWSDIEPSAGSISTPFHSRHHSLSPAPSPFQVTYKAPPTVSISLSAACSQSIPGEQSCGSGLQGLEPDLPDVKSVVPFPSTQLDGDMDVEMLDGTCVSSLNGDLPSGGRVTRKRRSAHSSVSYSPGILGKDTKQKRPRKSRRQVAEHWWLGVVHRSILRSIEARQPTEKVDSFDGSLSGPHDLGAMDRMLVERIEKRLAGNSCGEGRLPSPLPRISPPSISVPSLNRLAPSAETLDSAPRTLSSESTPKENGIQNRITATLPASKTPPCASLSIISYSPITTSTTSTSRRRHVHFEIVQRPRQPQSRPNVPRRSPSPPARTSTAPSNNQMLTLTIPQLVASLTFTYHEKGRSGLRGRTCRPTEDGKNVGRPLPSVSCQVAQCSNDDAIEDEKRFQQSFTLLRVRLSSTPERKSPLSCVAYVES